MVVFAGRLATTISASRVGGLIQQRPYEGTKEAFSTTGRLPQVLGADAQQWAKMCVAIDSTPVVSPALPMTTSDLTHRQ